MTALAKFCEPVPDEGAVGYLIRALALNNCSVREALEYVYGCSRRHILHDASVGLAQLTGLPLDWFERRLPRHCARDRWREVHLLGQAWRDDWTLRGLHQQVCPHCLTEFGYARACWDLYAYTACHVHGTVLLDHCSSCGRCISPDRPALDVCSCGRYLGTTTVAADPMVVQWSASLDQALTDGTLSSGGFQALQPVEGLSPDGGYRLLLAFGGGHYALRGRVLNGVAAWLTTMDLHAVLATALERMAKPIGFPWAARTEMQRCANSLAEQTHRGVTAVDRTAAGQVLQQLGQRPQWRNRRHTYHDQLDLFGSVDQGRADIQAPGAEETALSQPDMDTFIQAEF